MKKSSSIFTQVPSRLAAAVVGALVAATLVMAAMNLYLPFGQIDNIVLPLLFFPFIWLLLFLYCWMAKSAARAWGMILFLSFSHSGLMVLHMAFGW